MLSISPFLVIDDNTKRNERELDQRRIRAKKGNKKQQLEQSQIELEGSNTDSKHVTRHKHTSEIQMYMHRVKSKSQNHPEEIYTTRVQIELNPG